MIGKRTRFLNERPIVETTKERFECRFIELDDKLFECGNNSSFSLMRAMSF